MTVSSGPLNKATYFHQFAGPEPKPIDFFSRVGFRYRVLARRLIRNYERIGFYDGEGVASFKFSDGPIYEIPYSLLRSFGLSRVN